MTRCLYIDYPSKTKSLQLKAYENGVGFLTQNCPIDSCEDFNIAFDMMNELLLEDTKTYMTKYTADALISQVAQLSANGCMPQKDDQISSSSHVYIVSSIDYEHCNSTVLSTFVDYTARNNELIGNINMDE